MSGILKELKNEIARLSRKEIHKEMEPVKRVNASQRGLIAELRRQLTTLQKEVAALRRSVPSVEVPVAVNEEDAGGRFWITAKGVRTLRKRLGVTQVVFGKLAGVSGQTIVNWEGTKGKIDVRKKATVAKLKEIRKLNKRDVRALLEKAGKGK